MLELTKEEEKILEGEKGEGKRIIMKLLVGLAKAFDAKKLIKISRAHIAGISYENIGEDGLEFLNFLVKNDVKVSVPTTINPCGTDLELWEEMGVPKEFYENQLKVIKVYEKIGAKISCSCTPYFIDNLPNKNEHVAFAESSAVIYVNSFINAYTNKESGLSALASAIIGKTPYYGLHKEEERKPDINIKVNFKLKGHLMYGVLGYLIGKFLGTGIPLIEHEKPKNLFEIKEFCGGLSASSNIGLVHFKENYRLKDKRIKNINIDEKDLKKILNEFEYKKVDKLDYFFSGCPHLSSNDVDLIYEMVLNKSVKKNVKFWLFVSKSTYEMKKDMIKKLRKKGIYIFSGACPVISPLNYKGLNVGTDSIKAAHYLRSLKNVNVYLVDLIDAINLLTK